MKSDEVNNLPANPVKKKWAQRVSEVSMLRIGGFSLIRLWTFILFYSVLPYFSATEIRTTLYENQTISLIAFVLGAGLIFSIYKPRTYTIQSHAFIWAGGMLAAIGSALCFFSDVSTPAGMLTCALSAVMTGIGSSFLFVLWVRMLFGQDRAVMLIEYGMSTAIALVCAIVLLLVPHAISLVVITVAPAASATILSKLMAALQAKKHAEKKDDSNKKHANANGFFFMNMLNFSKSTKKLFAKGLACSLIYGFLVGFTDIVTGFSAFSANDNHGLAIFLVGILAAFMMLLIGMFSKEPLDLLYRFSMLLLGTGFVLIALTETGITFYVALSIAGYSTLIAFMLLCCHIIYRSFRTGATQTIAICIGTLYIGEALGLLLGDALVLNVGSNINISLLSILCTIAFMATTLFVFNEADLTHAGIGELETELATGTLKNATSENADDKGEGTNADAAAQAANENPITPIQHAADVITQRYGLSQRQSEVLLLLLQGRTMARIQETLYISPGTVSTHTRHIYQKVGVANRQALLDLAFSENLEEANEPNHKNL